jgi:hypothetical protein
LTPARVPEGALVPRDDGREPLADMKKGYQ